jgi:hypothetical protein
VVRNAADGGGRGAGVPPGVGTTTVPWVVGTGFGTTPKVVRVPVSSVVTLGAEGTGIGVSEGAELVPGAGALESEAEGESVPWDSGEPGVSADDAEGTSAELVGGDSGESVDDDSGEPVDGDPGDPEDGGSADELEESGNVPLEDDASEGVLSSGPVEMLLGGAGVVSISVLGEGSGVGDGVELEGGGEGGGVGFGGGFEGGMTGVFVGEPGAWGVVMVFPGGLAGAGPLPIGNGSSSHFSVISTC